MRPRALASRRTSSSARRRPIAALFAVAVLSCIASAAFAQGDLNVICGAPLAWCEAAAAAFTHETGITVRLAQKDAGEALAQIVAERADPKHDLWYSGSGDLHLRAAELGLTEEYRSALLPELREWAARQAEQSGWHTVGIHASVLGIGYNVEALAKKRLPEPKCWADLARPDYRGQVRMAHPGAVNAAYAAIATLVQIFGEERAFELLAAVHANGGSYPRTGAGAMRAAARGEASIAVTFLHDGLAEIANGFPIKVVVPCEGTGYEIGSMSIIKGARNLASAKKFYDWALTPAAQGIGVETKHFELPSNRATPLPPGMPPIGDIKLIAYDFARYDSPDERSRLVDRWERDVQGLPR